MSLYSLSKSPDMDQPEEPEEPDYPSHAAVGVILDPGSWFIKSNPTSSKSTDVSNVNPTVTGVMFTKLANSNISLK